MQNTIQNAIDGDFNPGYPKLGRQRLHDLVVEHLQKLIVEGVLEPGAKLNEREVCESLGISRTPLREAMKVLATEGLIEIIPNRGAFVSKMNESEISETFEVMGGLEAIAGELAAQRITAAELAEIRALNAEMVECRAKNDLPGYYRRNQTIHNKINEAAGNEVLRQVYLSLNRRLLALRFKSNFREDKWDRAVEEHEQMLQALEMRDGKRLAAILRQHLLDKRDSVLLTLRENEDGRSMAARASEPFST